MFCKIITSALEPVLKSELVDSLERSGGQLIPRQLIIIALIILSRGIIGDISINGPELVSQLLGVADEALQVGGVPLPVLLVLVVHELVCEDDNLVPHLGGEGEEAHEDAPVAVGVAGGIFVPVGVPLKVPADDVGALVVLENKVSGITFQ